MNIEETLPKITKKMGEPSEEQTKFDLLYFELAELDKDVSDLIKLIGLRGDGYNIPQTVFNKYGEMLQKLDDLAALNITKSRYEDLIDCFADLENIYFELEEIDDKCMKEPTVIIEDVDEKVPEIVKPVIVEPTEEVIEIKEKIE